MNNKFSINQLEEFTGIQKHTIRIWEKRFAFVKPQRSDGNLRYYSLEELTLLLDVVLLNLYGEKISKLALLNENCRKEMVANLNSQVAIETRTSFQMIVAMYAADIELFEKLLDAHVAQHGIHRTVERILIPFLERIKLFSYSNSSVEVHFAVTAIRKKIISAIEQVTNRPTSGHSALLFLPRNEHFDLLLLYMAYQLKKCGVQVWYLGTDITVENLQSILSIKHPTFLIGYVCPGRTAHLDGYLKHLLPFLNHTQFLVASCDKENGSPELNGNGNHFHFSRLLEFI